MWSRSQGTAVNWVRWVSSCRHTHSRKSCGSTSSSRSTWTMLGATSSSRPGGVGSASSSVDRSAGTSAAAKVSYWPRTREDMNASSIPTSRPVTLPPMTPSAAPPGSSERRACIRSVSGVMIVRKPATLALTQPGRSTTRTGVPPCGEPMPVNSRTWCSDAAACRRSSATAARASSRLTSGPGRTSRVAVDTARFQSTMSAISLSPPEVLWSTGVRPLPPYVFLPVSGSRMRRRARQGCPVRSGRRPPPRSRWT